MSSKKKEPSTNKPRLHQRNRNNERYDFSKLIETCPDLAAFVSPNKYGDDSIDFANPEAVKMLNKAILKFYYNIEFWDIPEGYLCPPIPGRADYIHHMADLLCTHNYGKIPTGPSIKCLDIGIGANCIYPLLGLTEYGWSFIGSDIDPVSIDSAKNIIENNPSLKGNVECRLQENSKDFFYGILPKDELVDLTICNPPFHASVKDANAGNLRKQSNLAKEKVTEVAKNFGGQSTELWYDGGERRFVRNMILQSKKFATNCYWFSTLISKQSNLASAYEILEQANAEEVVVIPMGQGNKSSRIVAWTFLSKEEQIKWKNDRWKAVK
ncbi:MAG: 23S rRNA (adenine(1618)-N(6))-methyltransferase RlmF [Salinivirgaceae bacterium]|nr:23S rRNA (adenine(1618)-N(6))-methyltransferase RlmF [Salinivirgaceae bacterium]